MIDPSVSDLICLWNSTGLQCCCTLLLFLTAPSALCSLSLSCCFHRSVFTFYIQLAVQTIMWNLIIGSFSCVDAVVLERLDVSVKRLFFFSGFWSDLAAACRPSSSLSLRPCWPTVNSLGSHWKIVGQEGFLLGLFEFLKKKRWTNRQTNICILSESHFIGDCCCGGK